MCLGRGKKPFRSSYKQISFIEFCHLHGNGTLFISFFAFFEFDSMFEGELDCFGQGGAEKILLIEGKDFDEAVVLVVFFSFACVEALLPAREI